MSKLTTDQLLEAVSEMTVLELSEFVKAFEEKFGVSAAAPVAVAAAPAAGPRHVLYVEDNPTNSELLREGLSERQDLRVSVATTAEEALDWLHNRSRGPRPDLILLDLHLPDASGMEVLRLLKANPDTAGIPVIMVSADAMPEQVEAALTAGAQSYQTKPVHLPTLLQLIDELLRH